MFIGGCAGSTTCGIKVFRVHMLYFFLKNQLLKIIYPRAIINLKYNNDIVQDKLIAVRVKEIISVQIYEKSSVAGGAKRPGFSLNID